MYGFTERKAPIHHGEEDDFLRQFLIIRAQTDIVMMIPLWIMSSLFALYLVLSVSDLPAES